MKKMMSIIMMLMLLISFSSLAFADEAGEGSNEDLESNDETQNGDNNDVGNNNTEKEIEIMNNSIGAEIRLLQLEKAITKNLLKGEMTVDVLIGLDFNTTELETILAEMRLVLEEVKDADPNASDAVEVFVDLISDAKNLTKQFKETLKDLLSDVKYNEIKEQIKEQAWDELQNYSKKIQNRIKQFNRNQIYRLYGIIGEGNNSYVNEYMNGTMSLFQVKMQISKMINSKIKEKMQIYKKLKAEKIKCQNNANETYGNATKNFEQREQERLQKRLEQANNSGNEKLMEKIQNKIQNYDNSSGSPGNSNNSSSSNGKGKGK